MASSSLSYDYILRELTTIYEPKHVHTFKINEMSVSEKAKKIAIFKSLKFNSDMKHIVRYYDIIDLYSVDYIIYIKENDHVSSAICIYNTDEDSLPYFDILCGNEYSIEGTSMSIIIKDLILTNSMGYKESYPTHMVDKSKVF
jgi:hypothetical protein